MRNFPASVVKPFPWEADPRSNEGKEIGKIARGRAVQRSGRSGEDGLNSGGRR